MNVCYGLDEYQPPARPAVFSIGNFDGVHLGHAQIIATARGVARRLDAAVVAMTFDPHPLAVLAPDRAPPTLTTTPEKLALLQRCGVDQCIVLRCEPSLLAQDAEDFLARLVAHCRPCAFVEGPDFNFGRGRAGSIETLQQHAARWGYEVHVVPAVRSEMLVTHPTISSSSIRQALRDGRVDEANLMLGRAYRMTGTTGSGAGRGANLGFPTANLDDIPHMLPQHAVYAAIAQLCTGEFHMAAVNIGPQPTFNQQQTCVEAFVLDFAGDLRGRRIGLHFISRLREQVKFSGPDELVQQIERDVAATHALSFRIRQLFADKPLPL
jgi:riboflavin kinase/FMN adenylyltransferase